MKRVVIRHVPEPATQRLLLEKGDIDIARSLTQDQLTPMLGNTAIRVETFPAANTCYLGMNMAEEHLKNPKVREALKMLVDYKGMVDTVLKGRFIEQQAFLPLGFLGAIAYNPYQLDVAKAKALLAEAGYPDGFELEFTTPNPPPWTVIAQSVQQTMGQAGIKLKPNFRKRRAPQQKRSIPKSGRPYTPTFKRRSPTRGRSSSCSRTRTRSPRVRR
jgi:peptide/nickel transport system substrate-binding protein